MIVCSHDYAVATVTMIMHFPYSFISCITDTDWYKAKDIAWRPIPYVLVKNAGRNENKVMPLKVSIS